jgi:prevent-host-death family protein
MHTYTLSEAKAKFSEVVERALSGEEIIVTKMGKPAVTIAPCNAKKTKRLLLGCMEGEVVEHGDFHEWPEDVARSLGVID